MLSLRNTALAAALTCSACLTPAIADGHEEKTKGFYLTGGAGVGLIQNVDIDSSLGGGSFEFDQGFAGDIGIGYDFGTWRLETSYNSINSDLASIQNVDVNNVGVDINSWFLSAAYDFRADKKWSPYVSAGIGTSEIEVDVATTVGSVTLPVEDDTISTFLGKLGITYQATENIDIYGEGWLQSYDDFTIGTVKFSDVTSTGVSLGARIKF